MGIDGYTKLFSSIVTSTIWSEDSDTRVVWITLLALADASGFVATTIPGLARLSGVSIEACEAALQKFESPDKYSRSQEHGGRRIRTIDGGFELLNHRKYRDFRNEDDRRRQNREAQQRWRERNQGVSKNKQSKPKQEAEAEAEAEAEDPPCSPPMGTKPNGTRKAGRKTQLPDDWKPNAQHRTMAEELGLDLARELEAFMDHAEQTGRVLASWDAGFRTWLRKAKSEYRRGGLLPAGPRDSRADAQLRRQLERVERLKREEAKDDEITGS